MKNQKPRGANVDKTKDKPQKKLEDYHATQLTFPFIFPERDRKYSNTIELYDAIPKYFWGRIAKKERVGGRFLDPIERKFKFRGKSYQVSITPARIKDKSGQYIDYYPGKREELVEDALRKMASDGRGFLLDDLAGVIFTLYELQQELKKRGHSYSKNQIKEAILICQRTNLHLEAGDKQALINSQLFETVGLQTQEDWKGTGKKTKCFVRFNQLVTRSIKTSSYRQLNYEECMSYKSNLARWLHKRMSHLYIQASFTNTYAIRLTTIVRDSGVKRYKQIRNNLREVKKALDEMRKKKVITSYDDTERTYDGRRIVDVKFTIKPSISFIRDMKRANKVASEGRKMIAGK